MAYNLFGPIKSERTFERVSTRIKGLILEGALKPGDRLPSENELAQQFGVSRQTIREALRILELSGFITIQKGGAGGPLIETTILDAINELFLDAFRLEKVSTDALTLARIEIERVVMSYAADLADEQDLEAFRKNIQKARAKIECGGAAMDENIDFHNLAAKASKNHVFVMVVGAIMAVVRDHTSRLTSNLEGADPIESVLESKKAVDVHEEILDAIAARDKKRAIGLMEAHIREVGCRLESMRP